MFFAIVLRLICQHLYCEKLNDPPNLVLLIIILDVTSWIISNSNLSEAVKKFLPLANKNGSQIISLNWNGEKVKLLQVLVT